MHEISPTALATLQNDMSHVKATLDRLVTQVEPVLLARSGDLAAIASLQRDISASHDKHREHSRRIAELDHRIDEVERRFDQAKWMVLGGAAVIQLILSVLGPALLRLVGLGG